MSLNGVGTISTSSPSSQKTSQRPKQSSDRGKQPSRPRKRHHGTLVIRGEFLMIDRVNPQTSNTSQQENIPRSPRKPPRLSTPPESVSELEVQASENDDPDSELCFICGNSMKERYFSLAPCNNAFCHNCSLRLRALYKSTNCPFCKVTIPPFSKFY
jgi:Zinc finger, C3HC4 type (RING finger)